MSANGPHDETADETAEETELRQGLTACLNVPRWVDDVLARAPYASLDALLAVAAEAATPLSPAEVDQAMADHPRIGERPSGAGTSASFSRAEQASSDAGDEELAARLAAGNAAYEAKFGRVFLVRAAGRSRAEILSELERRIRLEPAEEVGVVATELRDIALLRLPQLFGHLDAVSLGHHVAYDDPEAAR